MIKLFVLWTTFICPNSEVADYTKREQGKQRFFTRNLYSSEIYTEKTINKAKQQWRAYYTDKITQSKDPFYDKTCIAFMIQHEDVTDEVLLKYIMRMK